MLLLWVGLAMAGGGAATVLFGILVLETPFGTSLLVGGLILMSFGFLVWVLGLVIRKFGRGQNGVVVGNLGIRVAGRHVAPPVHALPGEANSSEPFR